MIATTLEAVLASHPGAHVEVIDRADSEGVARAAVFAWDSEELSRYDDGANAVAIYWLEGAA